MTAVWWAVQDSKARHRRRRGKKQSGGLFFSAWLVESRNVYREDCREVRIRGLAAELTAASGGNREARLGPRSDFSKPAQGL